MDNIAIFDKLHSLKKENKDIKTIIVKSVNIHLNIDRRSH